jgi:two-component system, OmpR family, sensor histidine kinase KdpD
MSAGRGTLRVYLGCAPGVGKTYAMLNEAHRRQARGTDVVVGLVETHGRAKTHAMIDDLEVIPRKTYSYRGASFEEMDLDTIIARHPQVVCVDELAHTNVPGSRNHKRWQDIKELLAAGITVISTVNIQHLESVNDVVEKITGIQQQETVPDAVVRSADQVELVDVTPEALRRRMAHGNIYPGERVDAALGNYFRIGNLTALRELALLWLADKVDDALKQYRTDHEIAATWEARERVVVALTGGPEGDTLIRRAARIAARGGADLLAVHVTTSDGLTGASPLDLAGQRRLVETLGGSYHEVVGDRITPSLLEFAHAQNATQLVIGASRRSALSAFFTGPGIGATTVRLAGDIDVHMVPHERAGQGRGLPRLRGGLTPRRRLVGGALAVVLLLALTLGLSQVRGDLDLTSDLLLFLLAVVAVSVVGGVYPGLFAAVIGSVLLNYYFTPPIHRFTIAERDNVIALVAFLVVAAIVSSVVDLAARRTRQAARSAAESRTLATVAGSVLRGDDALDALLEQLRETLSLTTVTLLDREGPDTTGWHVVATSGEPAVASPSDADAQAAVDDRTVLVARGRVLAAADQRLFAVFAIQASAVVDHQRLRTAAAAAEPLAEADRLRTALLAAVSHDLRSPLASATAAVDSLTSSDIDWTDEERAELLATADESLQRLTTLVENLLDMSRVQAGALSMSFQPTRLDEVVPLALDAIGPASSSVQISLPDHLPEVLADPALLERVIANVTANAIRFAPDDAPPLITGSSHGYDVQLRVIDHGPGIPAEDREAVFTPFQRLGDNDPRTGIGLGLALARGLTEAMAGQLFPEETPGGGLTMVIQLPAAQRPAHPASTQVQTS